MDIVYINDLYDCYGNLLTDKQQKYFEDYYFNNLTLAEISDNYHISRNAIHKQIKEALNKLYFYEDKLNIYSKKKKIRSIIEKIDDQDLQKQIEEVI
ncbi:MAG: sigma factor-like helix-turn-helix DNA-binding protein [Bacilli bacterium]|nr:sigma factor-like helix-turn-helix DNA-binding protein [Bacilli bacterium]